MKDRWFGLSQRKTRVALAGVFRCCEEMKSLVVVGSGPSRGWALWI